MQVLELDAQIRALCNTAAKILQAAVALLAHEQRRPFRHDLHREKEAVRQHGYFVAYLVVHLADGFQ